jgi:hypothetical protein
MIKCDVIMDLIPLYHDGVCSEESRKLVEAHLESCESCRVYLAELEEEFKMESMVQDVEQRSAESFVRVKKELSKNRFRVGLISAILTLVIGFGAYWGIFGYELPMAFEPELVSVTELPDGGLEVRFNGDSLYGSYWGEKIIEENGVEKRIKVFYLTETLWTRLFANKEGTLLDREPLNTIQPNVEGMEVAAVYYWIADFHKSLSEFSVDDPNAVLVWENPNR